MTTKMKITRVRVSSSIAALLLLGGCASHVTPEELKSQIESGDPPTIIDVRSQGEYRAGHVPGALHLPFWSLAANLDRLPEEARSGPVVIYCEHGPRAGIARAQIWFTDTGPVYFLEGHMTNWRSAGFPLIPAR